MRWCRSYCSYCKDVLCYLFFSFFIFYFCDFMIIFIFFVFTIFFYFVILLTLLIIFSSSSFFSLVFIYFHFIQVNNSLLWLLKNNTRPLDCNLIIMINCYLPLQHGKPVDFCLVFTLLFSPYLTPSYHVIISSSPLSSSFFLLPLSHTVAWQAC